MFEGFRSYQMHNNNNNNKNYYTNISNKKVRIKVSWLKNILDVWYQHCVYIWDPEVFDTLKIVHDHRINVVFEWYCSNRRPSNAYTNTLAEMNQLYCCPDEIRPINRLHSHDSYALISVAHDMYALHAQLIEMVAPIFWWQLWRYNLYPALNCENKNVPNEWNKQIERKKQIWNKKPNEMVNQRKEKNIQKMLCIDVW